MIYKSLVFALMFLLACASAEVYFMEKFEPGWESRWVKSKHKEKEGSQGEWGWSAGKYYADAEADKGLQTTQDARFYQISSKMPKFSNKGKDLVLQYSVKHEQNIDCGGGYIKIHPTNGLSDQENYNGDSPYNIMFGPDICGSGTKRTHLIFNYKGTNHLVKKEIKCESDEFSHLYTLVLHPDNTYEVLVDGESRQKGSLKEDWDMLPAREIKDPKAKKPDDWVDDKQIPDPEDKKPAGWDDIPAEIADPDAEKPEDWDDELDGKWEPPMIDNPDYKGPWQPRMMDNPAYKGEWVHPMVANPDFKDDDNLYLYEDNAGVGFELWQVKAGTIFDNIIITDSLAEANKLADLTTKSRAAEKAGQEKADEERRQKEEEERKAREAAAPPADDADDAADEEEDDGAADKDAKDEL